MLNPESLTRSRRKPRSERTAREAPAAQEVSLARPPQARHHGPPESSPLARDLAPGRAGGGRLLQGRADGPERLGAPGAPGDASPEAEARPRRRAAELRPELRAHLH